jgi:hypothetical protein
LKKVYLVKMSWNQVGDRIHWWWFNWYETKKWQENRLQRICMMLFFSGLIVYFWVFLI